MQPQQNAFQNAFALCWHFSQAGQGRIRLHALHFACCMPWCTLHDRHISVMTRPAAFAGRHERQTLYLPHFGETFVADWSPSACRLGRCSHVAQVSLVSPRARLPKENGHLPCNPKKKKRKENAFHVNLPPIEWRSASLFVSNSEPNE